MQQTFRLFKMGLRQTTKDGMVFVMIPAPFLLGFVIKFGLPFVNQLLEKNLSFSIVPWYSMADAMLVALTPMFLGMVSAFILLEERDEGTGLYYQITPVEGYSYLVARVGFPMLWGFLSSLAAVLLLGISKTPFLDILLAAIISTILGTAIAMMVVSFAENKVEGLAISKLSGIIFIGLFAVWFAPEPYAYFGGILPTYWLGDIMKNGAGILAVSAGLVTGFFWIALFTRRFLRRV
jgi:fluoroquinolone transport system permease protein